MAGVDGADGCFAFVIGVCECGEVVSADESLGGVLHGVYVEWYPVMVNGGAEMEWASGVIPYSVAVLFVDGVLNYVKVGLDDLYIAYFDVVVEFAVDCGGETFEWDWCIGIELRDLSDRMDTGVGTRRADEVCGLFDGS